MSTLYHLLNTEGANGKPNPGIAVNDKVIDLSKVGNAPVDISSTLMMLEEWDKSKVWLSTLADECANGGHADATTDLSDVKLLAPLLYPSTIFCMASNYAAHTKEMGNTGVMPDKSINVPVLFQKTPRQTVVGDGSVIHLPRTSTAIDWESEVAVVIGKPCFAVSKEDAFDYVAGYTVMNDMSVRGPKASKDNTPQEDAFRRDRFRRKNWDGSAPMGPWITPKEHIKDIYDQSIELWLNGEQMQNGNSGEMWWRIEEQIAYLSEHLTLAPPQALAKAVVFILNPATKLSPPSAIWAPSAPVSQIPNNRSK
jgi:2-keto-4-pentenoate hydratase/2-oxohepta-3-ene-1,7-dioic acid hydratase in catechol pathway